MCVRLPSLYFRKVVSIHLIANRASMPKMEELYYGNSVLPKYSQPIILLVTIALPYSTHKLAAAEKLQHMILHK